MTVDRRFRVRLPLAAAALALAASSLFAAEPLPPGRRAGSAKMISSPPFPSDARKNGVEGNVVLSGVITADGSVTGLEVLASSSPLITDTALHYIEKWKFAPAVENGKPVPLTINAVVRFRKDRARVTDPGSLGEPIVGNLVLTPADLSGKATATEGFPVENRDSGLRGVLDLDLPKAMAHAKFRLVVTDVFPSGKSEMILDQEAVATGSIYNVTLYRAIDARRREEQGVHTLKVAVDGRNAGGARYRVAAGPTTAPPARK
jgi:TonB family protein